MKKYLLESVLCALFLFISHPVVGNQNSQCTQEKECNVGVKTLVFFDKSRERPVITEIYYPSDRDLSSLEPTSINFRNLRGKRDAPIHEQVKKLPLIVMSHGYMGDRYGHEWLQELLAANGYIVAVPDHFGNTHYLQRAEDSLKRWNRAKDISYVIDQLLDDSQWKQHIDPERIGFAGFSLGGLTGIWLAGGIADQYPTPIMGTSPLIQIDEGTTPEIIEKIDFSKAKTSYEDKRIKAEFLMAPAYGVAFSKEGLSNIDIPIMIVSGQGDKIVPVKDNAKFFADHIKSSAIKILPGRVGHYIFLNAAGQGRHKELPSFLTEDDVNVNREKVQAEVGNMAIKFFNKYVKEN